MKFFIYIFLSYIIQYSSSNDVNNYCDLSHYCDSCTFCGEDTDDYCSCNFYNSYCLLSGTSNADFSENFILNYDGCITSNDNTNICGSSIISISSGKTTTITFPSTSETDFVCYYSVVKKTDNNKIVISINNEDGQEQKFDLFIITYQKDSTPLVTILSDSYVTTNVELTKHNIEKLSIYLDVGEGQNLDKLSLSFLYNDYYNETTTVTKSKSSNKTGWIVGIVIGAIALIIIIIVSIILCKRCRNKKRKTTNNDNNNVSINNTTLSPQYIPVINDNKEKFELMLNNELRPKTYNKNNFGNDCYNCTICMENFIDNSSVVITTKCNHCFHEKCFKNWVYKNIINPKCPNCNNLIFDTQYKNSNYLNDGSY